MTPMEDSIEDAMVIMEDGNVHDWHVSSDLLFLYLWPMKCNLLFVF